MVTRIFDSDSLPGTRNVRQISITGRWEGTIHQEGGVRGASVDQQLTIVLKSTRRNTQGEGVLRVALQNNAFTTHVRVKGKFVYERFLKLEYEFEQGVMQFGFVLLELSPDGNTLEGRWMGFGALSQSLIYGTMRLRKQGATLPTFTPPQANV